MGRIRFQSEKYLEIPVVATKREAVRQTFIFLIFIHSKFY
jgi:hypothetical protein